MADDVLKSFAIALGFVTKGKEEAKRSLADYEKAVKEAEKRIEDARWEGAKTEEEIAKLSRETNLKLAREALANAQQREKAEVEQARKRKEHNAAFIAGLEKAAVAALALATAVGYAFSKVAGSFDNLYFQAQRAGTSVQSLKSIGYAFDQTGGSANQALASVDSFTTKIRNNPGLRQFAKDLGVDDKLQGVDKYIATLDAIKNRTAGTPFVGVQYAEMLGISEENYNLFLRQGEALKAYKAEYDALSSSLGQNSEKAAEGATAFSRSLTRLRATAQILTEKLLAALAPAIQQIIDRFQAWIAANPGVLDKILTDIANAIIRVAEGIAKFIASISGDVGDKFLKKWDAFVGRAKAFAETVERIVYGIERILKFMHLISGTNTVLGDPDRTVKALNAISGGTAAPNGPGGRNVTPGDAAPADDRSWWQKHAPTWAGGREAPGGAGGTGGTGAGAGGSGVGSRAFRNNNPGSVKYTPLTASLGATGKDEAGFAVFPSYEAGRKAQEKLLFESKLYAGKTIQTAIEQWAPRRDHNDPDGYAKILAKAAGVPVDTPLSQLNAAQRSALLDAQQRNEGWIPGSSGGGDGPVTAGDAPAPAGTPRITSGLATITTKSGRKFQVAAQFAENFRGFLDDYEKAGGHIGSASGGLNERPGNASYHPVGRAIDVNQIGRGVRSKDQNLPLSAEDALAAKWGLRSGNSFRSNDNGHFEVHSAAAARAALERIAKEQAGASATPTAPANVPKAGTGRANMTPGGFDVNALTRPSAPMGIGVGSSTTTIDNRSIHQSIQNHTKVDGVEKPHDHARAVESTLKSVHQMSLENAQSAIA